jgi:di/tricarboxylate transporter
MMLPLQVFCELLERVIYLAPYPIRDLIAKPIAKPLLPLVRRNPRFLKPLLLPIIAGDVLGKLADVYRRPQNPHQMMKLL